MSAHQTNQINPTISGTYQYQFGDQVLEIPSSYQLENVITSGGVSMIFDYMHHHQVLYYIHI